MAWMHFGKVFILLENRVNWEKNREQDTIMWIDNVYLVKGIGVVLSGTLRKARLRLMINSY